jgi:hypothetical protein
MVFTRMSSLSEGCTRGAEAEPCWREPFYLCVSRTEVLLMVSNTSSHKRLHGLHRFTYHIFALFTACKCLAVLAHDLGREGSILLCFI